MKKSDSWHWALALPAAVWLLMLLYDLDLRPPHHDEGVNGWYIMQMWRQGFFRYDPSNYHGPLFFYLLQLSEILFGKGIVSLRLVTVVFAAANALLVLAHRRFFGRIALWAALALAFSTASIFYGRYAIHETVFIFFQLLFSFGYFNYARRVSWRQGVVCMTAGFFGTVLIKETFFIFFGTWFIALMLVAVVARFLPEADVREESPLPAVKGKLKSKHAVQPVFAPADHRRFLFRTLGAGLLVTLAIYSGFLINPHGVIDMVVALAPWLKTGMGSSGHEKPFFYWLNLMRLYEWPALAALAATALLGWRTSRLGRFWCALAVGGVLAYSLIPYKTPWLILNQIWPLCFVFGYGVETLHQRWPVVGKGMAYLTAALLVATSAGLAARLTFRYPDDPKQPYVYTHSHKSIVDLTDHIERACARHPEAKNMRIVVAIQQTWPLPWTLSDYPELHFDPFKAGNPVRGDVLLVDIQDQQAVEAMLDASYYRVNGRLRDAYTDILYYYREARFKDTWPGAGTLVGPPPGPQEPAP